MLKLYTIITILYYIAAGATFFFEDTLAGILFSLSALIMTGLTIDEYKRRKR